MLRSYAPVYWYLDKNSSPNGAIGVYRDYAPVAQAIRQETLVRAAVIVAARCRFADRAHVTEPGCAVRAAVADGTLDPERLASWRRLQGELRRLALKQDARLRSEARRERRRFARSTR